MSQDSQLQGLSSDMDRALASARFGALAIIVLACVSLAIIGYWLNRAHNEFTATLTPETGANYAIDRVKTALPNITPQLKEKAIEAAPKLMDLAEERLNKLPDMLADQLVEQSKTELDKVMPKVEEELLKSLKTALDNSKSARKPGESDEAFLKGTIEALGTTYETESIKLVDSIQTRYATTGADLLGYLEFLADNKGLTRKQSLQRQALVNYLTLAARAKK